MAVTPGKADHRVFVIAHRNSLWGLHVEQTRDSHCRRTQVVAFENQADAERVAHRLWAHRLAAYKWPNTILEGRPLWIRSADDILTLSPSPLKVSETELDFLTERLAKTHAAVCLVKAFGDQEEFTLNGRYHQAIVPDRDQREWLQQMHKQRAPPRD